MRMFAAAIAVMLFAAPATAQVTGQVRNNVGNAVTEAAPRAGALAAEDNILNGQWTRTEPHPGAVLVMQTGADGVLTGTFGGRPCTGAYKENRFTLFCRYSEDFSYLLTGRATRVELSNSARSRLRAGGATIEGRLAYLTTGLRADGSTEFFNAARN